MDCDFADDIDVQEVLRQSYAFQEDSLDVDLILSSLYQNKIISRCTRDNIRDQRYKKTKARILLDHLERVSGEKLLDYCRVLEESSKRDNDELHRQIAVKLRADAYSSAGWCVAGQEAISDVLRLADCDSASPTQNLAPGRIDPRGVLQSSRFTLGYRKLWDVKSADSEKALATVDKILNAKISNQDVKVGFLQAAAGFDSAFIEPLLKALELCDSCTNSNILRCRINWHLMWCYDRQGDKKERDRCLDRALTEVSNIGPDFSVSFISAWKAYHIMIDSNRDSEILQVEKTVTRLLEAAHSTIVSCLDMRWFVQAVTLYKANWHLKLHQLYTRRQEFETAVLHKKQMIASLGDFEVSKDPLGFATRMENVYPDVCRQMQCGLECPRSEFGRFACQLYLKFGQFNRARKVIQLVGSEELLRVIDAVEVQLAPRSF